MCISYDARLIFRYSDNEIDELGGRSIADAIKLLTTLTSLDMR